MFGARENLLASWIFTGVDALPFLCFADAMGGGSVGDWERNLRGGSGSRHGGEKRSEDQQSETEGSLERLAYLLGEGWYGKGSRRKREECSEC